MKILILFFLFFAISSCKNFKESSLNINVDPLTQAYKKNNVEYYLKITSGKDTIYTIDSVCVNKNGLITLERTKKGWFSETRNEYDSLNRIIKSEHNSDIHYKSKMKYKLDKKSKNLSSFIYAFSGYSQSLKTKPVAIMYHKFINDRLVEEILYDIESKDTVRINKYFYNSNNKIQKKLCKKVNEKYEDTTEYKYNKNNILTEIVGSGEVKYISQKTGLIDSVKQSYPNERITYKYYFRMQK